MALDDNTDVDAKPDIDGFIKSRAGSEALAAPLSAEDWTLQSMEEASPVKWNLAHTSWFYETFVLAPYVDGYEPFHPVFGYLFNSYYNQVGDMHPRARRGMLSRPSREDVLAYRRHVTEAVVALAENASAAVAQEIAPLLALGRAHEEQHQELLLTDLKHGFYQNPLLPAAYEANDGSSPTSHAAATGEQWIDMEGGLVEIGAAPGQFSFDNEGPRHKVYLKPFGIAAAPVSNRQFQEFIDDGGYRDPRWWLADGWALVQAEGWRAPLYWDPAANRRFSLFGEVDIDPDAPVCHVSFYEAAAYAEWTGFRLPSEFEWEHAAGDAPRVGNLLDPARPREPAAPSSVGGLAQLFGDVWEWTASPYTAYPGYRAAPGAIGEYNGKFMSSQMVLRGGSCATPIGHIRASYRNFFPPNARWQYSGLRLARDY